MDIILTQPNYAWSDQRVWKMPPYTLALLNACLKKDYDAQLFDPNYKDMTEGQVFNFFRESKPKIVGVSSISTEYKDASERMNTIIKKASPNSILIQGGIIPTVTLEVAMRDLNVDFWVCGESDFSFPLLVEELTKSQADLSSIDGLAYWKDGIAKINPRKSFIEDLDKVPFPDYGNLNLLDYGNQVIKYTPQLLPRNYPFAITSTSRGCPYRCIFCAGPTVSGRKTRFRSTNNVLSEIDMLYKVGIREVIFLDDNFLGDRDRAVAIMQGLIERKYDLTWKGVNVAIFHLDKELLKLMRNSGCYQLAFALESGSQYVVSKIIKKPLKLFKVHDILDIAKSLGFEIISNFVIGFPGETWDQIRETFSFAESINVDMVIFHIATPLPKTRLMDICVRDELLPENCDVEGGFTLGFGKGVITTSEFTPSELEIVRTFEWDRINFSDVKRQKKMAEMVGITIPEMEQWRINTRRKCGINIV